MIASQPELDKLARQVTAAPWIAIDTEADSLHAYPEKLCLLQVSLPGVDELVDPLSPLELRPLADAMRPHTLILHGGDFDLRLLHRHLHFTPAKVFDTMIAARFLGLRQFSLNRLTELWLGVILEKGSQKANWSRRPLTQRMVDYAHNDTRYLKPLADLLTERLNLLGRLSWHAEACARMVTECAGIQPRDPDLVWRIKRSDGLSRRALAVLREVWRWREKEALRTNKPPYFVLSHEATIAVAQAVETRSRQLPLPSFLKPFRREQILQAVQRGLELPSQKLPALIQHLPPRLTEQNHRTYHELRVRRDAAAQQLGLDPSFIASRTMLIDLSFNDQQQADLMNWQRELLGLPSWQPLLPR